MTTQQFLVPEFIDSSHSKFQRLVFGYRAREAYGGNGGREGDKEEFHWRDSRYPKILL